MLADPVKLATKENLTATIYDALVCRPQNRWYIVAMRPPQESVSELRARAEATFKARHEQKQPAPLAVREYHEAEQALRDRTAKLRAERLAREANKRSE
jgi:hypothetical protein